MKVILDKSELEEIKAILNVVKDVEQLVISEEYIEIIRKKKREERAKNK